MEREHGEKPCRACTDFKSWMKFGPQKSKTENSNSNSNKSASKSAEEVAKSDLRHDCPPDVNEIGRGSWTLLHTMSVYMPESKLSEKQQTDLKGFIGTLSRFYPCNHCAADMRNDIKADPPEVGTGRDFAQWLCRLHNKVNVKLGKPEFDCNKVYERWRDGYPDGRCD